MKKTTVPLRPTGFRAVLSWLICIALMFGMMPVPLASAAPADSPVQDNLVLWLDANNNTGTGTHDANATQWVNLANTDEKVDVTGYSWGKDNAHSAYYLNLESGCIFLPDSTLDALAGKTFTIEFLMSDFPGAPAAKTQNIMTITGDDKWLASLTGPVATPNDNFVLFQNASGKNNSGYFCFRTCYGAEWEYIFPSSSKYCMVDGTKITDSTNSLTFNANTTSNWYLNGVKSGSTINNGNTIDAIGFRTDPGKSSTWQTERRGKLTFGIDTDIIASREEFSAQVKSIRIYTDELTEAEVQQNAAYDQACYYTDAAEWSVPDGYVTEDLVLFLDGLNNDGTGAHSTAASKWANLVNTNQTVDVTGKSWGNDYLDLNGYINLPDEVRRAISSEEFTVEFLMEDYFDGNKADPQVTVNVMTLDDSAAQASGTKKSANLNDCFTIYQNYWESTLCFKTSYWSGAAGSGSMTDTHSPGATANRAKVATSSLNGTTQAITFKLNDTSKWYQGGNFIKASSTNTKTVTTLGSSANNYDQKTATTVIFGAPVDTVSSRAFQGKVKAIRVYKGALTAEEVAQNAAMDEKRYYPTNVPDGYVEDGLVLFLDAINNTGNGHSSTATSWANLAKPQESIPLPSTGVGSGSWHDNCLDLSGYIKLPESVRKAIAGSEFTVEFLMDNYCGDPDNTTSNVYNIFCLTGDDEWIGASTSKVTSPPNDYFVMYQHNQEKGDHGMVRFKIANGSNKDIVSARADVSASTINGATQSISFNAASNLIWYQDGTAVVTRTSTGETAKVDGFNAGSGYQTTRLPQVLFGAAVDRVTPRAFTTQVKAIRIYDRALSAAEVAKNAEADASRYITVEKLTELAKDSWNEVLVGNASATTAADLQTFAASKLSTVAAEHLNVSVTDNADGTFTFTYTSKNNVAGYTAQSYTLFVDTDYVVDFSTMSTDAQAEFLKDAYAHQGAGGMTLTIEDGKLVYKVKSGSRPVSGLYLPVYYSTSEYVWEMEIAYSGSYGWAGQLFGVKAVDTNQNTCTFNLGSTSAAAVYEFCRRTEPNLWAGHVKASLTAENFGDGKLDTSKFRENYSAQMSQTYTLKYVVKDGMAFGFIDGVLVVESANLGPDFSGGFGINSAAPVLEVKSIKISTDVSKETITSTIGYYDVDIYEPQTEIQVAPTIMQMADGSTYDISDEAKRPASIIFDVKAENGELMAYDGETKLGTFDELFAANNYKAITGVRIADQAAADLVAKYVKDSRNGNLWVFYKDGSVINSITDVNARVRGVIDLTGSDVGAIVNDDIARTALYDKVYGPGYRTVLISAKSATEEVIRELQSMKVITLVEAYDLTAAELYDLVVCGPNGILTDDYMAAIEMLESFEDYTLVRPSAVVAHRGDRNGYPDNSLESIVSAAKSGAAAAEFDVIATKDGKLVLSHDDDNCEAVEYRNKTWNKVTITNAYWSKEAAEAAGEPDNYFEGRYFYTFDGQTAVPYITLDQLFDATGTQYPALTYHIEVKDYQNDTVNGGKLVVNLIDELLRSEKYSYLRGRCDILCFSTSINTPSKAAGYAVHNQSSITATGLPLANAIYSYEDFYRPINSLLEPGTNIVTTDYLEVIKHYGMTCYPWTYNNRNLYVAYVAGYHGFTTDYPHVSDNIYKTIKVEVAEDGTVTAKAYTLADHMNKNPIDVTDDVEIIPVAGTPTIANGAAFGTSNDAVAVRYKQTLDASSGQTWFYLYSESLIPAERQVKSIVLTNVPKTEYKVNAVLDVTSGQILVTYNDNTQGTIALTTDMVSGFDSSKGIDALELTVTYGGCTDTYTVEVVKQVSSIHVSGLSAYYEVGDELNVSGAKVLVVYDDETTAEVALAENMVSGFDSSSTGQICLTITYGGKTTWETVSIHSGIIIPPVTPNTTAITVEEATSGSVAVSNTNAVPGETVIVVVTPESGYEVDTLAVTDGNGNVVKVTAGANGQYSFTMPVGTVKVTAVFKAAETEDCDGGLGCPSAGLSDIKVNDWFHPYVDYVVLNGLMSGVGNGKFAPNDTMTRAMVWTVLARLDGENVDGGTPWYAKAQAWAMAEEVSDGTMPNEAITREQLVTMLYRFLGEPEVTNADRALLDKFSDGAEVSEWAVDAMAWAVSNGIITGVTETTLDPQGVATRAQVAAILKRFCEL